MTTRTTTEDNNSIFVAYPEIKFGMSLSNMPQLLFGIRTEQHVAFCIKYRDVESTYLLFTSATERLTPRTTERLRDTRGTGFGVTGDRTHMYIFVSKNEDPQVRMLETLKDLGW